MMLDSRSRPDEFLAHPVAETFRPSHLPPESRNVKGAPVPRQHFLSAVLLVTIALAGRPSYGATVPAGFSEALIASGLASPTAMQFAPDGRLFVCEQAGRLRVIKNGVLLAAPLLT
jgi:glucose/arabinose dehydrogenase